MFLQSYDFTIVHTSRKNNILADALSRIYEEQEPDTNMEYLIDPTLKEDLNSPQTSMVEQLQQFSRPPATLRRTTASLSDYSDYPQLPRPLTPTVTAMNSDEFPAISSPFSRSHEKDQDTFASIDYFASDTSSFEEEIHRTARAMEEAVNEVVSCQIIRDEP